MSKDIPGNPTVFLSDKQVGARYGVHRMTVHKWTRENDEFPKPVKLSPACTRWKLADLEAFEAERSA